VKDPTNHTVPDPLLRRAAREASDRGPSSACVEPDVLAAWADRTLSATEVRALETHAAACGRCRALLDAMVQSEPARSATPVWWKAPALRWTAPFAAIAGAMLVWVAVERQSNRTPASVAPTATVTEARPEQRGAAAEDKQAPPKVTQQAQAKAAAPRDKLADSAVARQPQPSQPARAQAQSAAPAATPSATPVPETQSRFVAGAIDAIASPQIVSPDPSSRWRIGSPGTVGRSTDGGLTWEAQAVDTKARLVAGASPAAGTCWLVGAAGTVLKTTDGRTWKRLPAPDPSDLVSVTAQDANAATVTTADGRSFHTTDGGLTWSRLPLQENPTAPF
jgi:hypothetical protein